MDARGFDTTTTRTFARESILRRADWTFMVASVVVTAVAVAVSVHTGQWRFLFS